MSDSSVIRLHQIGKTYRIYDKPEDRLKQMFLRGFRTYFREFYALQHIELTIRKGETVALVGCNGSGKSTLLQIICGTLTPTAGMMDVSGRISALLELGAGFNPDFSGKENIFLNAAILGLSKEETERRYEEIVTFSGLEPMHLQQPVKTYSSGMYVRLAFAVAVAVEPDILVVDEALAVGDEGFQRKCYARLRDLQAKGTTILFVSHAAQTVIDLCDRAVLMDHGEILQDGAPKAVIASYHRLLFASDARRQGIREAIKSGDLTASLESDGATDLSAIHDEGMISESRIEYEKHGGEIRNIRLTDQQGNSVNWLQSGGRYQLRYTLYLTEDAVEPRFGMLIKTKRGFDVGGAAANHFSQTGKTLPAGQVIEVCFNFDCPLRPGHYFANCGAMRREGDREHFIHRIVDALQFKVSDERILKEIEPAGIIDLNVEAEIRLVEAASGLDRLAGI